MHDVTEPFSPPRGNSLAHIARLPGTDSAVVLMHHRNGPSRIYEAHALAEPFSQLTARLTRDGHRRYCEGALAEDREKQKAADRIATLTAERDEARRAVATKEEECDRLRAEVNRLRAG